MEKFIAVILSLVMALAIVGCSGNANAPAPTTHKGDKMCIRDRIAKRFAFCERACYTV